MGCIGDTYNTVARIGNLCYSYSKSHFTMKKISISKEGLVNGQEYWSNDLSTQQHVRTAVHYVLEELGIKVEEEWEMDDDSIEITVK